MKKERCKICGDTDPSHFTNGSKSKCKSCGSKEKKLSYVKRVKKVKGYKCIICDEDNPDKFYPEQKNKCKLCVLKEKKERKLLHLPVLHKNPKIASINHEALIKDYSEIRDMSIMSEKYGTSITSLTRILKLYNIEISKRQYPSDESIISTYYKTKKQYKTAELLGCSEFHIDKILDKHNIKKYGSVDIGDKFNRFTVIGIDNPKRRSNGESQKMLICECDCGSIRKYSSVSLRSGKKTSCGCIMKEKSENLQLRLLNKKVITPEERYQIDEERKTRKVKKIKDQENRREELERKYESIRCHVGDKVNRWIILSNESRPESKSIRTTDIIKLQCDCGTVKVRKATNMKVSVSCGCYQRERSYKNGLFGQSKEEKLMYVRWKNMKKRCYNIMAEQYINYGMRGITICDRWMEPNGQGYVNFCTDMGPRPGKEYSIDRIDNDGNYEPSNCQWATSSQQARNQRRNRRMKSPPIPF